MYEPEINNSIEPGDTLPDNIRRQLADYAGRVTARTILPWGEHCTECVWPTCYTTCDLYSPRRDGNCRQFVDGMVRVDHKKGVSPYLLKIRFKQWGKLWTIGNLHLVPTRTATQREHLHILIGAIGRNLPAPDSIKPKILQKINYLRRRSAENNQRHTEVPDCFLLECYNPGTENVSLTFTIRHRTPSGAQPFHKMVKVSPGYNRTRIAFHDIGNSIDMAQPFEVEIVPNASDNPLLYFGLMDFVKERSDMKQAPVAVGDSKPSSVKCIVWDLDNTLWDGILVEDGPQGIRMREGVIDVIKKTDERGILHSIASKNNHDDAMKILRQWKIDEYFLYPQIQWQPKSQSIAQIAQLLNIGVEAIAFVDDQAFERAEVKAVIPPIVVIDAADYACIPARPECRLPATDESKARRSLYREQEQRSAMLKSYEGDYLGFLRDCQMKMTISPLRESNLKRVYELAQRTNQLNFSGNRYREDQLSEIMGSDSLETYVIECSDRFGKYGIVGFGVIDTQVPRLLDLMFSCRVQGKRVEHATLSFLLQRFVSGKKQDLHVNYRKTPKNAPSGRVFEELGFEKIADKEGVFSLVFKKGREIPGQQVIEIKTFGFESELVSTR